MRREQVFDCLEALAPALRDMGFRKLYLFGSVARGEARANDVDLLFEVDPENDPDLFQIGRAKSRLEEQLGRSVDLVDRKLLHPRIRGRVEAEMIEIY